MIRYSDNPKKAARDREVLTDKWMPEVLKKEAEILAGNDAAMAEMQAEMARQRDGWSFRCRRFGDFLSIEIERRANPEPQPWPNPCPPPPGWGRDNRRYAATINLGKVTKIVLHHGKEPDTSGGASYYVSEGRRADNPNGPWTPHNVLAVSGPPKPPDERAFLAPSDVRDRIYSNGFPHDKINHRTTGLAYPADDDRLSFYGWETLLVPTGLGQSVLDALHAELDRGWPIREAAS